MHCSKLVLSILAMLAVALAGPRSDAQTLTSLLSFNGTDGQTPAGALTLSGSTLYGTTTFGGANGVGEVYSVGVTGGTPTVLWSFNSGNAGTNPAGGLTLERRWLDALRHERIFWRKQPSRRGFQHSRDRGHPHRAGVVQRHRWRQLESPLTLSADGSTLYGATEAGANGAGTIFSLPVTGGTPALLASFNGTDGNIPSGLILSADGSTLYGTTDKGGTNGDGEIFSIPVTGGTPNVLWSFNGTDGANPDAGLTLSADGSTLFGTTEFGAGLQRKPSQRLWRDFQPSGDRRHAHGAGFVQCHRRQQPDRRPDAQRVDALRHDL